MVKHLNHVKVSSKEYIHYYWPKTTKSEQLKIQISVSINSIYSLESHLATVMGVNLAPIFNAQSHEHFPLQILFLQ